MNSGTPSIEAATKAFGNLSDLDKQLDRYLMARTISALTMQPAAIGEPQVAVRALSAGEAALIDQRMISTRGVNRQTAQPVFAKAQPIAARFPDDPVVQGWFAEMAYDAYQLDVADAAADRAIAADPKSSQGLLYKGMIGIRRAVRDKADAAAWKTARAYIVRANKLDPDNAQPLFAFYESYLAQGVAPTKNAVDGLIRSQELAPQDPGLRFVAMTQSIRDGELARAKRLLQPLAYNPHASADSPAIKLLAALDMVKDQKGAEAALDASLKDPAAVAEKEADPSSE